MSERNLSLPPELERLSAFIDSDIECVAGPSSELRSLALCAAKYTFDWALETEESSRPHLRTLLSTLAETIPPQTRSRTRKVSMAHRRSPSPALKRQTRVNILETPILSLLIEGMNIDQIWQQLDLRAARVCENLQVLQGESRDECASLEEDSVDDESEDEEAPAMDVDDDDESPWEGLGGEDSDSDSASPAEGVIDLQEETSEDEEDIDGVPNSMPDTLSQQKANSSWLGSWGYTELDDGFFDLATFNAETDEVKVKGLSKIKLGFIADDDSTEESEVDLFGSVDGLGTRGEDESHVLFYNDFFKSPVRVQNKSLGSSKVRFHERVSVKKIKAIGKGIPVSCIADEDDLERTSVPYENKRRQVV